MNENRLLSRFAARIINTPLLMAPDKLNVILGAIGGRIGLDMDDVPGVTPDDPRLYAASSLRSARDGGPSIAVIPVYDTLVYRSYGMNAWSGLTSYERIRERFNEALNDSSVTAIVFDIDSPGGEVAGVFDLADDIYHARGAKAIYAVANEMSYSAAYAIASAADEIFIPRTGGLGSIGVIAVHVDRSGYNAAAGLKYTPIFSGARKNDFSQHDALSDEAYAVMKSEIADVYDLFVETVARNRGMTATAVRETEAGIFQGKRAAEIGLADHVMAWSEAIDTITTKTKGRKMKTVRERLEAALADVPKDDADSALREMGYFTDIPQEEAAVGVEKITAEAREDGRKEALSYYREVMEICSLAGMNDMALTLIEQNVSTEDARKKVIAAKAGRDGKDEIRSTVGALTTGEVNPLIANAKRRAEAR
ncbi:MAG TPA: S49 family peptidase [Deltaproteobacteria bacterium]|nr:S49 family peptidase [Deltaproteobacteria bacterium]